MSETDPPAEPFSEQNPEPAGPPSDLDPAALQADLTELSATHERLAARLSAADD